MKKYEAPTVRTIGDVKDVTQFINFGPRIDFGGRRGFFGTPPPTPGLS